MRISGTISWRTRSGESVAGEGVDSRQEAQKSITASQHGDISRRSASPTQLDGTQQCSWESCNLVGILEVADTFLDHLNEWEPQTQEYEGERSQSWHLTLLSQSEMWSGWRQVQQVGSIERCARTCQSFFSLAESSTRMVEEWRRNLAAQVRHRWTLTPLAKAKERDSSCADVPAMQQRTASSSNVVARARGREGQTTRLTTVPPSV